MEFDFTGLLVLALIGLVAIALSVIAVVVAIIAWFLGYWEIPITIVWG